MKVALLLLLQTLSTNKLMDSLHTAEPYVIVVQREGACVMQ